MENLVGPQPSSLSIVSILIFHFHFSYLFPLMCLQSISKSVACSAFGRISDNVFCKLFPITSLKMTRHAEFFLCFSLEIRSGSPPSTSSLRLFVLSWHIDRKGFGAEERFLESAENINSPEPVCKFSLCHGLRRRGGKGGGNVMSWELTVLMVRTTTPRRVETLTPLLLSTAICQVPHATQ